MLFLTAFIPRSFIEAHTKRNARMFAARVNSRIPTYRTSPARHVINARINIKLLISLIQGIEVRFYQLTNIAAQYAPPR